MSRTKPLHDLQLLDHQSDTALDRLARVDAALGRAPAVVRARAALEARLAELAGVEAAFSSGQAQRHALRDRIAAEEALLYGGRTVSARELEAQKANIDAHRRRMAALDDEALTVLLDRDAAEAAAEAARQALAEAEAAAAATDAQLQQAQLKLRAGLKDLAPRIARARAEVPAADLSLYDRLRSDPRRNGVSVAKLAGEACSGCGRTLTTAEAQRAALALTQCPACGRILHA